MYDGDQLQQSLVRCLGIVCNLSVGDALNVRRARGCATPVRTYIVYRSCLCNTGAGPTVFLKRGARCQQKSK